MSYNDDKELDIGPVGDGLEDDGLSEPPADDELVDDDTLDDEFAGLDGSAY